MKIETEGLEFDPGFAQYIFAFQGTIEYLYNDINRFKNFSQRKIKFKQYYKKILDVFYNNLGFYVGCLMWAAYINTQPEQKIINNTCYGQAYTENENTYEVDFMIKFTTLFPKDMQYFLGEKFDFPQDCHKILSLYREFLIINQGFTKTETNTDVQLPQGLCSSVASSFKEKIEKVLEAQDLSKLIEYKDLLWEK